MAGQAILGEMVLKDAISTATALSVETLVASHARMVFRIAYSVLRNHHDAEDAAQECFLRVVKHRERLHKIRNPKTWLARVAWTTALDKRRAARATASLQDEALGEPMLRPHHAKTARAGDPMLRPHHAKTARAGDPMLRPHHAKTARAGDPMETLADPAPGADEQLAQKQMQRLLERLIAGLPDALRLPLELSTVQELNSTEIGEVLDIPEASVRTRLYRARAQLKEKLAAVLEAKPHD